MLGIFTDGDLRRLIERGADLRALHAARGDAPRGRRLVRADALAVEAAELMEQHRITSVLVVDADGRAGRRAQLQRPDAREGDLMAARPCRARARPSRPSCCCAGARASRAAIFDVDGVLTDGGIYIGEHGETLQGASRRSTATA